MVRVWWAAEDAWYTGTVDKVTAKRVEVYYEAEDAFAVHNKDTTQIERIKNVGECPSDSDDDVPLTQLKQPDA